MKVLKNIIPYVVIVIAVVLFRIFIATPIQVVGSSMYPTLKSDEILILNKISKNKLKRFDIVVIKYNSETIIKRIIGLPGEKIEYIDNVLYVNGEIVDEPFEHEDTNDFSLSEISSESVPEDSYFVVGDNRGISMDSRIIGFIDKKDILGKASLRLFPINKLGIIK